MAWKAKNLPRDELNLVQKINHVDCAFRTPSEVFVLSAFNRMLFYDTRAQKKAVADHNLGLEEDALCTSMCLVSPGVLAVGNSQGSVGVYDVTSGLKMTRKLNEQMAGITDLVAGPDGLSFASGTLTSQSGPHPVRVDAG